MIPLNRLARPLVAACAALAVAAPAAGAATGACPDQVFEPVFAAWNDTAMYALVDNGDLETGTTEGWTLTGAAALVDDNPRLLVKQLDDSFSLELPPGSSATSPLICVGSGYPTSRMFAHTTIDTPDSGSSLQVEVLYTDAARGGQAVKKLGSAPDEPVWDASRKMSLAQGQLNIKPDSSGNTYIRYRFTPLYHTTWRIDDLHVDPRLRD